MKLTPPKDTRSDSLTRQSSIGAPKPGLSRNPARLNQRSSCAALTRLVSAVFSMAANKARSRSGGHSSFLAPMKLSSFLVSPLNFSCACGPFSPKAASIISSAFLRVSALKASAGEFFSSTASEPGSSAAPPPSAEDAAAPAAVSASCFLKLN
ncbi:MAG: hypothetical protein BWY32_03746 [bacterium ADurb.Bin243]|nr:MAG: hypothetical protein BWY32_03746 [bacterium ADurb.Bin243]